jgi:hypothetical protein
MMNENTEVVAIRNRTTALVRQHSQRIAGRSATLISP